MFSFCFTKAKFDTHARWSKYEVKSEGAPKHSGKKKGGGLVVSSAKNFNVVFFVVGWVGRPNKNGGKWMREAKVACRFCDSIFLSSSFWKNWLLIWKFGSVLYTESIALI